MRRLMTPSDFLDIDHERLEKVDVIRLEGILDENTLIHLKEFMEGLENQSKYLVFNIEKLDLMDSVGIGYLMKLFREYLAQKGTLSICFSKKSPMSELFSLVQLETVLTLYETEAEAVENYRVSKIKL